MSRFSFSRIKNKNLFREAIEFATIGNRGVQEAILKSQKMGVPMVFGVMDSIFYRMPDGSVQTKNPFKKIKSKKK